MEPGILRETWKAEEYDPAVKDERGSYHVCVFGQAREVCRVQRASDDQSIGWSDDVAQKLARVIAAAPELLDALTDLVGGYGKEGDLFDSVAIVKAQAAIAKAKGETE